MSVSKKGMDKKGIVHRVYVVKELIFVCLILYDTGVIYISSPKFG